MTNPNDMTFDERLLALEQEAEILEETPESMAVKVFRRGLVPAALQIVEIAQKATSDRVRLAAAQYVVERNLGKVGDMPNPETSPLDKFLQDILNSAPAQEG